MLSGTNLFLAASFSSTPTFDNPTEVPPQFTGTQFIVPHPVAGVLYLKLRDDPSGVQMLTLPVTPLQELPALRPLPQVPAPPPAAATIAPAPPSKSNPAGNSAPASSDPATTSPAHSNTTDASPQNM
jgi:hypothetical protein